MSDFIFEEKVIDGAQLEPLPDLERWATILQGFKEACGSVAIEAGKQGVDMAESEFVIMVTIRKKVPK